MVGVGLGKEGRGDGRGGGRHKKNKKCGKLGMFYGVQIFRFSGYRKNTSYIQDHRPSMKFRPGQLPPGQLPAVNFSPRKLPSRLLPSG